MATDRLPLVVGCFHHEEDNAMLLDAYARKRFQKEVCPEITDDTLLIIEGRFNHRPVIDASHKKYHLWKTAMEEWIGVRIPAACAFSVRDRRCTPSRIREEASYLCYDETLAQLPLPRFRCHSLGNAVKEAMGGLAGYSVGRALDDDERRVLEEHRTSMQLFDHAAVAVAKEHADAYRPIIICGASHALAIHVSEKWEIALLVPDTRANARHLLREYYNAYVLASQV